MTTFAFGPSEAGRMARILDFGARRSWWRAWPCRTTACIDVAAGVFGVSAISAHWFAIGAEFQAAGLCLYAFHGDRHLEDHNHKLLSPGLTA